MNISNYLDEHGNKSLLRVLTCGSVDDGKSTLIGRLLYDSKLIFEDQLSVLKKDSEKNGTTGAGEIDYALLLDGLKAEREQGITIDVAYRYFTTPGRKFIIADCPGHEQYTRNMATGASTADVAIILIDARHGVLTQTRRHAYIVSLLGIRHLVVAVNKMDIFDYDESVFKFIRDEFREFAKGLQIPDVQYVPVSALKGENVVSRSSVIPWYTGSSLLEILETVDVSHDRNRTDFRYPVQYVIRPDLNFRGFAGQVVSGTIRPGDEVTVLPSLKTSRVKRIVTADGDLDEAFSPLSPVLELEDEIDISSGDMIVKSGHLPRVTDRLSAIVIWMTDSPLKPGGRYVVRHAGRNVKALVTGIQHGIDVNTLGRNSASSLELNAVGRVSLETTSPLYVDDYQTNRATGVFILIDPLSNTTVGAGMIVRDAGDELPGDADVFKAAGKAGEKEPALEPGLVSHGERLQRQGHFGKAILIAGEEYGQVRKLARHLERSLFSLNCRSYYLGFAEEDVLGREEERTASLVPLAYALAGAGMLSVAALPSFPAGDTAYWPPATRETAPQVVWIGKKGTAPRGTHVSLSPEGDMDARIETLVDLLLEADVLRKFI